MYGFDFFSLLVIGGQYNILSNLTIQLNDFCAYINNNHPQSYASEQEC